MRFLFKYATMGRPEWFKKTLDSYYTMLSDEHEYRFLITLNEDDPTMNNPHMREFMDLYPDLEYKYGNHADKIDAINADMDGEDFDILFVVSDDMIPIVNGFDLIIAKDMELHFPNFQGALHYHDGFLGKDITITLSIMGKKLYDRFGYIYHPDYNSFYCDNEFTDMVKNWKKVYYSGEVIVKHAWTGGKRGDHVYRMNTKKGVKDKSTYEKRKELGFPKERVCS